MFGSEGLPASATPHYFLVKALCVNGGVTWAKKSVTKLKRGVTCVKKNEIT